MAQQPRQNFPGARWRWRPAIWGGAALVLVAPGVAMLLTDEVNWSAADFLMFAAMLAGALGLYELAIRMTGSHTYRAAAGFALATAFLLVWINLAVGIIGNEGNPANLVYAGVIAVGVVGALIARLRAWGMARALLATAVAQALVAAGVMLAGYLDGFVLSTFFVGMWLVSAQLFRRAAQEQAEPMDKY